MAKIFGDSAGTIISILLNDADEATYGIPPIFASMLEFDYATNQTVIDGLHNNWNAHTLIDGVLYQNGNPVTIWPPTDQFQANLDLKAGYAILPDWAKTSSAANADVYITNNIFNAQTKEQVDAWIDAQLTDMTIANLSQINARLAIIRTMFKFEAEATIIIRGLLIIIAKLLIYIRDLIIRFRK